MERQFLESHPGEDFDESWHALFDIEVVKPEDFSVAGRERIVRLEDELKKLEPFECPLKHYFVNGLYVREIFIPAGVALVGYIHMYPCITTVSKGRIAIYDGLGPAKVFAAPTTMCVAAGTKKAGYALEDTIWSDAYLNLDNDQDIDRLEARLTANTHQEYLERSSTVKLEHK